MATSDEDAAHRSASRVCFPLELTPINTYCHLKSTERYKNVSRALAYTWYGRFSDGSTDNTSRGWPKYNNCRLVIIAPDAIYCDERRTVREVAGMAGMSYFPAMDVLNYTCQ